MNSPSIGALRQWAISAINQTAAEARMRYQTAMLGMDMVYTVKLAQARNYITANAADSSAAVPAYVAADVAAMGGTALDAAQAIVAAADAFHGGPGPAIEQARRAGKVAVQAASTAEAVAEAKNAAVQALLAI
jgi:hypothetical protein